LVFYSVVAEEVDKKNHDFADGEVDNHCQINLPLENLSNKKEKVA